MASIASTLLKTAALGAAGAAGSMLAHKAFRPGITTHGIATGSNIIPKDSIITSDKSTLTLIVGVSNTLDLDIAEKLGRDLQVYKLQMVVQSILGVMINEMKSVGLETDADTVKLIESLVIDDLTEALTVDNHVDKSIKNVFSLKPSWTKVEIPITNVSDIEKSTPTNYVTRKDKDGNTTNKDIGGAHVELGQTIGRIDKMQILLATQAIGFGINGKALAYSFLSKLDKSVNKEYNERYNKIENVIRAVFNKYVGRYFRDVIKAVDTQASIIEDVYLHIASLISAEAGIAKFNKQDAKQKIAEAFRLSGIQFPTIMLDSEDFQGLEITSSILERYTEMEHTNIIVYNKKKREIKMYIDNVVTKDKRKSKMAPFNPLNNPDKNINHSIVITYPDSQLGRFRYLNSVDVF